MNKILRIQLLKMNSENNDKKVKLVTKTKSVRKLVFVFSVFFKPLSNILYLYKQFECAYSRTYNCILVGKILLTIKTGLYFQLFT